MVEHNITRRRVLQTATAGSAGLLFGGSAAAQNGPPARIVGTASRSAERAAKRRADSVKRVLDFGDIGKAVAGKFSDQAVRKLRQRDDVRYVEDDSTYHALETVPWGIDRVDADVAHSDGFTGSGADIAIIDTGIDDDHPDLQANIGKGKAFGDIYCGSAGGGCRFGYSPNDNECNYAWSDDNDHGTHCAGIADAVNNTEDVVGVSTEATLHAAKVLDGCGSGSLSAVADGIKWVADQGYDVGSMSLGASSGDQTLKDACQYAYDNGVLLVAAAGNDGPCTDCVGYPAAYSTVIAVSSTASDDSLSDFSSTGPEVELAAPGTDILSTVPPESSSDGTDTFSGTSMACPHVSGAGSILMANGQTNTEARSNLQSTAEDIGLADNESGYGLLDAEAAANTTSSGSNSTPTVDSLSASEVETSDSDAEFDVSWDVGDADGNLSSVDLSLYDDTDGHEEDSATISVSGSDATGTTRLVATGDDGSGNSYTVDITVTDSSGATASDSTSVSETEDTSGGNAPTVDSLSLGEDNSGGSPHAEFDASWSVSDSDGDLDTVDLTLTDTDTGATEDSTSVDVSGSDASGTTGLKAKFDENNGHTYEVELVVTDTSGNAATDTATEVEDGA